MMPTVQVLLILVCSGAVALGSRRGNCQNQVDLVAKYKLQGERISRGRDEGRPVCPCEDRILKYLVVDFQIGSGYNKRTQREECWVAKEDNIKFVARCLGEKCDGCSSYPPKRCVPVASKTTFYAICSPVRRSYVNVLRRGSQGRYTEGSYGSGSNTGKTPKDFKIRKLTLDIPSCCQCQTFKYGC